MLDMIGNNSLSAIRRALSPEGILVVVGGSGGPWLQGVDRFVGAGLMSRFVRQTLLSCRRNRRVRPDDLYRELIEAGKVTPVIDRTYPLSEAPEAIDYVEERHARGKVVIIM